MLKKKDVKQIRDDETIDDVVRAFAAVALDHWCPAVRKHTDAMLDPFSKQGALLDALNGIIAAIERKTGYYLESSAETAIRDMYRRGTQNIDACVKARNMRVQSRTSLPSLDNVYAKAL